VPSPTVVSTEEESSAAWMGLARSVIETLATHAFRSNEADYERFRQGLKESLDLLQSQPDPSSVLMAAGTLSQRIGQYHQDTQRLIAGSISELRDIIRVLISSVDSVQPEGEESASPLHQIEETIGKAQTAEELRIAKVHLTHALEKLNENARGRKQETSELALNLQDRVLILEHALGAGPSHLSPESVKLPADQLAPARNSQELAAPKEGTGLPARRSRAAEPPLDPLTGLPNKEGAEDAIAGLRANPNGSYLVAFYIQHMEQLNARFGDKVCNELLFLSAEHIASDLLRPNDQLFRWRGPAFVALLKREDSLHDVKREVQRVVQSRLQVELRGGALLLSATIVADTVSAGAGNSAELIQELENFFSRPSTRGG
jgi:GGDEF domain-containing protein